MKEKRDMNEETLKAIINTPFAGIEATSTTRDKAGDILLARKPRPRSRVAVTFALASAMVLIGVIALWPKPSAAAAFKRMQEAISNVQTMKVTTYGNFRKSTDKPLQQLFYKDGSWLMHAQMQGKTFWSLFKSKRVYRWDEGSTEASFEPYTEPIYGLKNGSTALDFVKTQNGFDGEHLRTTLKPNPDINGKPSYLLIIERNLAPGAPRSDGGTCEIVVDKATDLPINSKTINPRRDGGTYVTTFDYQFNQPFPAAQFEPCEGRASVVRDLAKERKDLKSLWAQTSLGAAKRGAHECVVHDVTINSDGNILMAYSGAPGDSWSAIPAFAPTTISDAKGTNYVRIRDSAPGGLRAAEMVINGHALSTCMWVALEPNSSPHDTDITVGFMMRNYGRDVIEPKDDQKAVLLKLTAKAIRTVYPEWSLPLHLDNTRGQQPMLEDLARGDYYKAHEKYDRAGYWYKQAYVEESKVISIIAYRKLPPAIECFEKAGNVTEALATKKQMLQDKAADTNLSEVERAKAADELKALG